MTSNNASAWHGPHSENSKGCGDPNQSLQTSRSTCSKQPACEGGTLTNKLEDKLNKYATSCHRIMLFSFKRLDFISNEEVLRQVQQEKLVQLIQQWQLHFLGHILGKPEDEITNKYALYHPRHGKRKVERSKTLFHQYIARVMCQDNPPTPEEMRLMAHDKTNWGKLVADCAAVG